MTLILGLDQAVATSLNLYTEWAKEMGVKRVLGQNGLTQRLQKLGVVSNRKLMERECCLESLLNLLAKVTQVTLNPHIYFTKNRCS